MGQPVVHFEIIGKDPAKLRGYFGELFGWEFGLPSPVSEAVSDPADYGFVNRICQAEDDVFVHMETVRIAGILDLNPGDRLEAEGRKQRRYAAPASSRANACSERACCP